MEKRVRRERKKLFTTTTELFEYKHKTTAINIEEMHIMQDIQIEETDSKLYKAESEKR